MFQLGQDNLSNSHWQDAFCQWLPFCNSNGMNKRFKGAISSDEGIELLFVVQCVIPLIAVMLYLKYGHQLPGRRTFLWRVVLNILRNHEPELHRLSMEINTTIRDELGERHAIGEFKPSAKANESASSGREYSIEADLLGFALWLQTKSPENKNVVAPFRANGSYPEDEHILGPRPQPLPVSPATTSDDQALAVSALKSGEGSNDTAAKSEKLVTPDAIANQKEAIGRGNASSKMEDPKFAIESANPIFETTSTTPIRDDSPYGTGLLTTSDVAETLVPHFGKTKTAIVRSRHRLRTKFDTIVMIPDADFTSGEMDVIDRFMQTLHRFLAEFGLNLPRLSSELVSAQPYGKEHSLPETYICIIGFTTVESVKEFDVKLSKSENRSIYQPLKLCYRLDRINRSAAPERYIIETSQNITYCGTLMISELEHDVPFVSTIGGLITIREKTYALTTNHPPEEGQHQTSQSLPQVHHKERFTFGPKDVFDCGDWRLALIQPDHRRPNIILQSSSGSNVLLDTPKAISNHYPIESRVFSDLRDVLIISGRSGLKEGVLSKRRTFMLSESRRLQEVWSIDLGFDDFQPGDSGSWVIHKSDSSVMGVLIARSTNCGYMVPFEQVQEDISTMLKVPTLKIFPSQQPSSATERTNFTVEPQLGRLMEHSEVENLEVENVTQSRSFLRMIPKRLGFFPIKRFLVFSAQLYSMVGVTWLELSHGLLSFFMLIKTILMPHAFVVSFVFIYLLTGAITAWDLAKSSETTLDHFGDPDFNWYQGTRAIPSWAFGLLFSACVLSFARIYGWLEMVSAWVKFLLLISIGLYCGLYALPSDIYAFMERPMLLSTWLVALAMAMLSTWLHLTLYFTRLVYALGTESERQSVDTGQLELSSTQWIDIDGQFIALIETEPKWKKFIKYMLVAILTAVMGICVTVRALTGTWNWTITLFLMHMGMWIASFLITQAQYNLPRRSIPFTGGVVAGASGNSEIKVSPMEPQTDGRDAYNQ